MQQFHVALQIEDFLLQIVGIGIELLSERHRHSVLQLCTSHLDGVGILISLIAEGAYQSCKGTNEMRVHTDERQTDTGRINVVGTLSAVTMVVG